MRARTAAAYAGPTGRIEPTPERRVRPAWLDEVAERVARTDPAWFSSFLPPEEGGRESAVLMLFGPAPAGASDPGDHVLLIERAHTMRSHAAQIAFPGGGRDEGDVDLVATALREAEEETGLEPSGVEVVSVLPSLFLPPSQYVVAPVLAWWDEPSPVAVRDRVEVHDVLSVPLAHLVDPENRHSVRHPSGFVGPAFEIDDLILWGFTGGLLARVLELAGLSRDWDPRRERPLPERYLRGDRP